MDPYALIAQYPNAGDAFAQSFQRGMQGSAVNALMQNPNDPSALAAFAQYDPKTALDYSVENRKRDAATANQRATQQAALTKDQTDEWHKYAANLAKWADTPQKWDAAVDYLLQTNHPDVSTEQLMSLKGNFSPQLRASFMSLGGLQDDKPQVVTPQPGGGAFVLGDNNSVIPLVVPNDGSQTPGSPAGNMPAVASPQDAMKLPPGTQFRLPDGRIGTVPGGAGGNASGGFRGP